MSEVLYFLLVGFFFYAMMRWGCGAHIMHGGHGEHGGKVEEKGGHSVQDPVCGMELDNRTAQNFQLYRRGFYCFCSDRCRERFLENPEKYIEPVETPVRR